MSADKIAAHMRKFADLPVIGPVVSALFPDADGDVAQIEELIDRIFNTATGPLSYIPPSFIYQQSMDATWIDPFALLTVWRKDDPVAELLADWKAEIEAVTT